MLPSLNGLRAFEAAARHLSFTRAAEELNVTPTAVSHQIRRLEEQLRKRLFVRKNRALALTRDAAEYLPAIRVAFDDLRRASERLRGLERSGLLTVSTTASLAAKWLVPRIASFQDAHPGIEVRLTTSPHLVDFRREEVDMAVRYGRGDWPGLRTQWLMPVEIFPVCSPALISGRKPLRRPEDLVHHTLLHTSVGREDWQLWLTSAGLPVSLALRRGLSFDDHLMALQAAMDGLGVALCNKGLIDPDIAAGRLVIPFDVLLPADAGYYIVTPEETADTGKIALFRDWLLRAAAKGAGLSNLRPGAAQLRKAHKRSRAKRNP
jgi:LysR family transcriptional regulator, glycine cleavage system transcriptional activator